MPTTRAHNSAKPRQNAAANQQVEIDGRELSITNLNKVYFPDDGYTKGDVIAYYRRIAPTILPYLYDRPEVLHRYPDGINGDNFYQKDVGRRHPDWVKTIKIESEAEAKVLNYLLCQDEATLVYLANLGCIEMNPWNSRVSSLDNPDFMVMDLDPEGLTFNDVVRVALAVHEVMDAAGTEHYVKTSGATGLHIMVPLGARYSHEQTREFALIVGQIVNSRLPEITSLERSPAARQGKIYLDYLQNRKAQTMAAPYSIRPRKGAPVSTPLTWEEVDPGLSPLDFTMHTIHDRLKKVGDLWKPVLGTGINMAKCLQQLEKAVGKRALPK